MMNKSRKVLFAYVYDSGATDSGIGSAVVTFRGPVTPEAKNEMQTKLKNELGANRVVIFAWQEFEKEVS